MIIKLNKSGPLAISTGMADSSLVQLSPGSNKVDPSLWEKIKNHPEVKLRLESKQLEIVKSEEKANSNESDSNDEGSANGIEDLSAKDAKKLIGETFNTALLREWQESEGRTSVLSAIEKQLDAIEKEREGSSEE